MTAGASDDAIAGWRAETPGVSRRHHLNNAGAALMPRPVLDAMQGHLQLEAEIGGYEAADAARAATDACYRDVAALLCAAPRNIAFTSSATASYALALSSFDFVAGDAIVTTRADYLSNRIMFESLAMRRGVRVVEAGELPGGGVDPDSVHRLVREDRPRLVAVTWVPTFGGLVQRVAEVGAICMTGGVPYLVDACQAVGQLPVDVHEVRCDFLAATARKFLRGPRGIGFLFVSDGALASGRFPLHVDMRGARWPAPGALTPVDGARRFEEWERPHALVLGLGAAARYAAATDVAAIAPRAHALAAHVRERLASIPGLRCLDYGERLSAIAAFGCSHVDAHAVVRALRERGVNTSAQGPDDNAVALERLGASSLLRISPHYYNDLSDIDALVGALGEVFDSEAGRVA